MRDERLGANALATAMRDWRVRGRPLSQTLAEALRESILDGRLPVGVGIPSERALATALGVSRSTLVAALTLLRRDGWLSTRHGSGSRTRLSPTVTDRTTPWSLDHPDTSLELDMTQALTAAPHDAYLAAVRHAAAALGPVLLADGTSSPGLPALREIIATRYTREGLPTNVDQILVTSGATAALHLLLDQLHDRRRPVLSSQPHTTVAWRSLPALASPRTAR
jgi:DNA-binding transcriptional MocR family regulator